MRIGHAFVCPLVALIFAGQAHADGSAASVAVGLEMPLATVLRYDAEPRRSDLEPFDHTDVYAGPALHDDDYGPQVPALLSVVFPLADVTGLELGARAGIGSMCLDGPDYGDSGRGSSWTLEPVAQFLFTVEGSIRPYLSGGPFLSHTCAGNTADQWESNMYGGHLGGGVLYGLSDLFYLHGEARGSVGWGKTSFSSHGETPNRWDAFDARGKLLAGISARF